MAEPVLGTDAVIYFVKDDVYVLYACATDIQISFEMETVSVRTITDGTWNKPRGVKKAYTIDLSGLIKFDDETKTHAFDLFAYFNSMTSVAYRIIFTNDEGELRLIEGYALPTSVNLGGGSEGFANGNCALQGDGSVEVRDLVIPCPSTITSVQLVQDGTSALIRITGHTGSPERYDYSVDSGGYITEFVDSFVEDLPLQDGLAPGDHTITIIPVCENGYNGTPFTTTFTILAPPVTPCDEPYDITFFSVDEDSAVASWSGSSPADGYDWELYIGGTYVQGGHAASEGANLTGLASGTTYTMKIKAICEEGVSESAFVSADFTTEESDDPLTFTWGFTKNSTFGSLKITKNGLIVLNQTSTGTGSLTIEPGSVVVVYVQEVGDAVKVLFIEDTTTPAVLFNDTSTDDLEHEFTVEAAKSYEVLASITE